MTDGTERLHRMAIFMNAELVSNKSHDAILQTLNREIGGYYFSVEAFQKSVSEWQNIPIIYAADHPDMKLFSENPTMALDKVKGRIVGSVQVPNIETVGHPRLMGNLEITDNEVNKLIDDGKISHSTGFFGIVNEQKQVTAVSPNHVLVFQEDANNLPKDRGAFILNKESEMADKAKKFEKEDVDAMLDFMKDNPGMMDKGTMDKMYAAMDKANQKEYMKSMLNDLNSHPEMMDDDMKFMIKGMMNKETTMGKEDELANQLAISNKEKEALLADKQTLEAQVKAFEQKEAEHLKATREAQWQKIKTSIPVGLTHKAEDEAKLRTEFEADPYGFAVKLTEFKQKQGTQEEGEEFLQQEVDDEAKADAEAYEELRTLRGGVMPHRKV